MDADAEDRPLPLPELRAERALLRLQRAMGPQEASLWSRLAPSFEDAKVTEAPGRSVLEFYHCVAKENFGVETVECCPKHPQTLP